MVLCPTKMTDFVRRHRSVSRKEKYKEVNEYPRETKANIHFILSMFINGHPLCWAHEEEEMVPT